MPVNTGPLGNAIALWLGIEPADLFLYVFLPPMLVDSAVRIDYFIFRKVHSLYTTCELNPSQLLSNASLPVAMPGVMY